MLLASLRILPMNSKRNLESIKTKEAIELFRLDMEKQLISNPDITVGEYLENFLQGRKERLLEVVQQPGNN